ncbi:MAG: hypothetical protein KC561_00950 [Myxococcales bacterium]|nr:hypothetical protein [Myxococcales bacterium]
MSETTETVAPESDTKSSEKKEVDIDQVVAFTGELLTKMGLAKTSVSAEVDGKFLRINIQGDDASGLIVGKGACASSDCLEAIQTVLSRGVLGGEELTPILDANNFRDTRVAELSGAAERLGNTVAEQKRAYRIHGMNGFDRRAFHVQLAENDKLETDSKGYGVLRTLILSTAGDEN